jgi:hypothetical protein
MSGTNGTDLRSNLLQFKNLRFGLWRKTFVYFYLALGELRRLWRSLIGRAVQPGPSGERNGFVEGRLCLKSVPFMTGTFFSVTYAYDKESELIGTADRDRLRMTFCHNAAEGLRAGHIDYELMTGDVN